MSLRDDLERIRSCPLVPDDVALGSFVYDVDSGALDAHGQLSSQTGAPGATNGHGSLALDEARQVEQHVLAEVRRHDLHADGKTVDEPIGIEIDGLP